MGKEQEIRKDVEKSLDREGVCYVVRFGEGAVCLYPSIVITGIIMQLRLILYEKSETTAIEYPLITTPFLSKRVDALVDALYLSWFRPSLRTDLCYSMDKV